MSYGTVMKIIMSLSVLLTFSSISSADEKLGTREVLLDNDAVEVVRLTYPVGSESGMHTHMHPNRIVYFVQGGKLELVPKDKSKQSKVLSPADGDTLFLPATTHNVRNVGDTVLVIIESEIKHN